jgi:anti-anti-sigma factor
VGCVVCSPGTIAFRHDVVTGPDRPILDFGVNCAWNRDRTVVTVRGEVDLDTAPKLRAVVQAVIDLGHPEVVLDLADVSFMGAQGLGIIAAGSSRLRERGGQLTLRSPSRTVLRILDITGLDQVVQFEGGTAWARVVPLEPVAGAEQARGRATSATTHTESDFRLQRLLRSAAAVPASDDVIDAALRLVVALARATVGGADGVSVSLSRHGTLSTVAASDQTISDMDADQYATGEGPCVEASVTGRWVYADSLDREQRWPTFIPRARRRGINAILSTPLLPADRPVGALNIYSRTAEIFTAKERELASVFAGEASTILAQAGIDVSDDQIDRRLADALSSRAIIAQAQGVIMARGKISAEEAHGLLRSLSVRAGRPMRDLAEELVSSTKPGIADGEDEKP